MKKISTLLLTLLLISCGAKKVVTSKKEQKGYQPKTNNQTQTTENSIKNNIPEVNNIPTHITNKVAIYIHQYKDIAKYEMQKHGIPASITLAQGILESGAGKGDLSLRANNHFGIKCHNWKGEKVYHDDDKKGECFRKYDNPSASFRDHSLFLSTRSRYESLFKLVITDYKGWAKGLRKAGYATDPKYPAKLINLIEKYNLHQYDADIKITTSLPPTTNTLKTYTIQQGDSLYRIAKKFNISVEKLKTINNLTDNNISIGQQLKLQ